MTALTAGTAIYVVFSNTREEPPVIRAKPVPITTETDPAEVAATAADLETEITEATKVTDDITDKVEATNEVYGLDEDRDD